MGRQSTDLLAIANERQAIHSNQELVEENRQPKVRIADSERCIPPIFTPEESHDESLEAIREGDAFLASGKEGRFTSGAKLIAAAMDC